MTEINATPTEGARPVVVKLGKLTEGIGTVFAGVLTMLEALDAGTAKALTESFAMAEEKTDCVQATAEAEAPAPNAEDVGAKANELKTAAPSGKETAGIKAAETKDTDAKPVETKPTPPSPGVSVDDVARIVVQKVKANPGINEKIRALVNAHGAQRVTELKPKVLEAFLTDLAQL